MGYSAVRLASSDKAVGVLYGVGLENLKIEENATTWKIDDLTIHRFLVWPCTIQCNGRHIVMLRTGCTLCTFFKFY